MNLEKAVHTFLLSQPKLTTRKAYSYCLQKMQSYIGPARPIDRVTAADVIEYSATLYEHNYARATIRKHIISIKAFFNFLVKIGVLEKSPAKSVKTPSRKSNTRSKAMTDDEYNRLLDYARKTSPRNYAMLLFFGDTGCREIALRRLRKSDLNIEDKTAQITGKGDKTRTVYFGDKCQQALRDWLRVKPLNTTDYVFRERVNTNLKSGELKEGVLSQIIWRITQKPALGFDRPLGAHSLRHRKGHQLADSGTPITVAAKALGHANTETTQIYYPNDDERVRAKMEQLSTGYTAPSPEPKKEESPEPKIIVLPQQKPG